MMYFYVKQILGLRSIEALLKLFLLIMIIPLFVPFSPKMPALGLDPSWALSLNQAVAQGLAFGKELIFTLGPYSAIYTKAYHPATDLMMISGSLYLACSYWFCLIIFTQNSKGRWLIAYSIFLLSLIYAKDSLFFSYPLLVGLTTLTKGETDPRYYSLLLMAALFAPFGLLPLIKGSLLIICLSTLGICVIYLSIKQRVREAIISVVCSLFVLILSSENLPNYLWYSLAMASNFTQAMAINGNNQEIVLYLIASGAMLLLLAFNKTLTRTQNTLIFCLFFIYLFLSFKTGFTRHFGHAFIAGTSILCAALLLPHIIISKYIYPIIAVALYVSLFINGNYTHISLTHNIASTYASAWYGFKSRIKDKNWLMQNFDLSMNFLKTQAALPKLAGTNDCYSYDQAGLIASDSQWKPRPIFQSYSVFTADMAEKNKQHLLGEQSPDHLLFKIQPIDNRLPALEDGASWPIILSNYQPRQFINGTLLLDKKETQTEHLLFLQNETHVLGELITLPDTKKRLFITVDMKPTIIGRLATFFFKPTSLTINLFLHDGSKVTHHFIAAMAKSNFLISPYIKNTHEFAQLFSHQEELLAKRVIAIVIDSEVPGSWQWKNNYEISLKKSVS
ncbi:MAG: hypothetical protein PSV35_06435 [bacterium]|nr:hypothetical protein [bacterium]